MTTSVLAPSVTASASPGSLTIGFESIPFVPGVPDIGQEFSTEYVCYGVPFRSEDEPDVYQTTDPEDIAALFEELGWGRDAPESTPNGSS